MSIRLYPRAAFLAAAFLVAPHVLAAPSYDNCTGFVDSLPASLSTQGTWCLRADLETVIDDGAAITLAANNITLDCNGFELKGQAHPYTLADGVAAQDRLNLTVRNCRVIGFLHGVNLHGDNGGGHMVEDNTLRDHQAVGVRVEGDGSTVRRNSIGPGGGGNVGGYANTAYGILTVQDVDVLDNTVGGLSTYNFGPSTYGITTYDSSATIAGNHVSAYRSVSDTQSTRLVVRDNTIFSSGDDGAVGVSCASPLGRAERNLIVDADTPVETCSSLGNETVP